MQTLPFTPPARAPGASLPVGSSPIRRTAGTLLLGGSMLIVGLSGCGSEQTLEDVREGRAEVTGQGVLVIAVDGLRWDHTSLSGYDRNTTPFLASVAEKGIALTNAWSPTPSLVGSHVAILSGSDPLLARPPVEAELPDGALADFARSWFIPKELWLLGRSFLGRGWNTAAFVDDPQIAELSGFNVGFREFVEFGGNPLAADRSIGVSGVGRRFVEWVNQRPLDENWFAYLHMHDLERSWTSVGGLSKSRRIKGQTEHWTPRKELNFAVPRGVAEPLFHVLPPSRASEVNGVTMAEYELRYDRGLHALDHNISRIIAHTDDFGRADNITLVIVGSFGMELGEHGLYLQAGLLEEEDLRVPVVIRPSAAIAAQLGWGPDGGGRVSDALVSLVDLAPTLADLLDLPTSGRALGLSQRSALMGNGQHGARERLFACSTVPPGSAVVSKDALMAFYRPGEASEALRGSWALSGLEAAASGTVETFQELAHEPQRDGRPGPEDQASFRDARARWEALILQERRVLHFGGSDSDRPSIGEFHLLQRGSGPD